MPRAQKHTQANLNLDHCKQRRDDDEPPLILSSVPFTVSLVGSLRLIRRSTLEHRLRSLQTRILTFDQRTIFFDLVKFYVTKQFPRHHTMSLLEQERATQSQPRRALIEEDSDDTSSAQEDSKPLSSSSSSSCSLEFHATKIPNANEETRIRDQHAQHHQNPSFFQYPCTPQEFQMQRRTFFVFVRLLMAYMELHDPPLLQVVRTIMRTCSKRSQEQAPGYHSTVAALHERLRSLIPPEYWTRAIHFTHEYLRRRQKSCQCNCARRHQQQQQQQQHRPLAVQDMGEDHGPLPNPIVIDPWDE